MSVSEEDFEHTKLGVKTLEAVRRGNAIVEVSATMPGMVGHGNTTQIRYKVLVTLDSFPEKPPQAWITAPPESEIRHFNIYHPAAPKNLPRVCVGQFESEAWSRVPASKRTLLDFFIELNHVLLHENPASKARS